MVKIAAWEVIQSAFIALIFLFFFIGFNIGDEKKYIAFKLLFIWLGFTLISPFLWIQYMIAREHITAVANIYRVIFITYLPIYILLVWILYITFFKDVMIFLREAVKGFKGEEESDILEN